MSQHLDLLSKREVPKEFDPTDIRNDIAETKQYFYDKVSNLKEDLSKLPEIKYYDDDLIELKEMIDSIRESIPDVPEIKYYDDDLIKLKEEIDSIEKSILEMPEVRYYENEINELKDAINRVENRIAEVKYYDDDIDTLGEAIKNVENKIPTVPEVKYYDDEVKLLSDDINAVRDSLTDIRYAIRAVEKTVEVVDNREIPEKFDPTGIRIDIEKAFKEIEKLKENSISLKENSTDPLVPLEDKFVTFDDLSKHYRLFINRVQQQLSSLGGGGEVNLRYLDDIDRTSIANGRVLSYDSSTNKFVFVSPGAASSLWNETAEGNLYKNANVGINSEDPQEALDIVGNANVTGVVTATSFTGEFVVDKDKTLEYYTAGISSGSLFRLTTSVGTKTFQYNNVGTLTTIIGTGVYVSKELIYDEGGNLISIDII